MPVRPFYIGESPVTNKQFGDFARVTGRPGLHHWENNRLSKDELDSPVTHVTWDDAVAYARWQGGRLPTSLEWELAARGLERRLYPWGDSFSGERCLCQATGASQPGPVGTFFGGRSPYGCYDVVGNVWEWTSDAGADGEGTRIVRGGSWREPPERVTCAAREARNASEGADDCGFRLVKDLGVGLE